MGPAVPRAGAWIDSFDKKRILVDCGVVYLTGWGRALRGSRASSTKAAPTRMGGVEEELARRRPPERPTDVRVRSQWFVALDP